MKVILEFDSQDQVAFSAFISALGYCCTPSGGTGVDPGAANAAAPAAKRGKVKANDAGQPQPAVAAPAAPPAPPPPPLVVAAPAVPAEPPKPTATREQANAALDKLFSTRGVELAMGALSRFGANRISELKAEFYADFVTLCEQGTATGVV